ncbi:homeodomain-interacting protein kinase 4-like [Alosa sapidissima]|uniref:homeodomain-interacting protein kinase 4-like n=1 Tax=Alosa sapidissima TaxID=34773 RepID=UPI001C090DF8|nr:homeodomain-interacting protein kinase 4-like [Alosa sapidissima]
MYECPTKMSDIYSETEVYHVLDTVGRGTFGKVTKCWRGSDGELVAVKIMKTDVHKSRVIKNELKLISVLCSANLDKSHIVKFYEAFPGQSCHYLVFELLEKNLYQLQKDNGFRPLAIRNIRTITYQVLKALAKLKELAIIHADLKPENVMIVDQSRHPFRVKVIDFGSASLFNEVRFVREPYIQSRFYRSPEILLGLPFCEKVDMWSLGCIIAELFLGWPLYPGESEYDQVRYICETQGIPHTHLLNSASKAHLYFELIKNSRGAPKWQLKHPSSVGKGGVPQSTETAGSSGRRKYIFSSLDELESVEVPQTDEGFHNEEIAAEIMDRHCMVELLKRTLTLDSHQRINPSSALRHHFITIHHLRAAQEYKHYYEMSRRCLQEAVTPARTSGGDGTRPHRLQTETQAQPPHPRGAYQPQRSAAAKQEHQYHSGSCQAAFAGKYRIDNCGATSAVHSQHNLVYSRVRKTTKQLDDLCIVDEQDMGTSDTISSEESDRAHQTPNRQASDPDNCPAPNKGTDEEMGATGYSTVPGTRRERSLGESIMSYFSSFCGKQQMAKLPQTEGIAPGTCGPQHEPAQDGTLDQSLVLYPQDDSMCEQDVNPPQVFLAETQDFLLEDMVTQDFLTQVLTQSVIESQDGDVPMSQDMVDDHSVNYPEYSDQAVQAGGEYVLQYFPYEPEAHPPQWPDPNSWMPDAQMSTFHGYGPSARSGGCAHNFMHY